MNQIERAFFNALQHAIANKQLRKELFIKLTLDEWNVLYNISREQGVLAIIFDALKEISRDIPAQIRLKWAYATMLIENRYEKHLTLANEICEEFSQHNIKTVVLKGFALSKYYPNPKHRECGDFDCYLLGEFEHGNAIAEKLGANVRCDDYKHSHINYKGLIIENHKFCSAIRGPKVNKEFEKFIQHLLIANEYGITPLNEHSMYCPTPTFNALFFLKHTMVHFLYEGIKVRHLLDWACLINNETENINWEIIEKWCDLLSLRNFVSLLNETTNRYIGFDLHNINGTISDETIDTFISNTLYSDTAVYNHNHSSIWAQRYAIFKNIILNRWKFSQVYKKPLFLELIKSSSAAIFERHPKL